MYVTVHEGEISVDLRAAQIREVLAAIGQQAGLSIYFDEAANGIVHAQFTGIMLNQGLRRLLRAAPSATPFCTLRAQQRRSFCQRFACLVRRVASQPMAMTEHVLGETSELLR